MILRLLTLIAFAGTVGGFVLAIRDLYKLAGRYCGSDEAGGNCHAIAEYFATNDIRFFAVFATGLAILLVVQTFRPTDK